MTDAIKKFEDLMKQSSAVTKFLAGSGLERIGKATAPLAFEIPRIDPIRIPTPKEQNTYQSAGVLVRRLAETVAQWRQQVPADSQPVVIAILQGGVQINVTLLAEESFHGIRVEGTIEGSPCMVLTHQASVQLLCFAAKVEKEEFRRKIGFIIDGKETEA